MPTTELRLLYRIGHSRGTQLNHFTPLLNFRERADRTAINSGNPIPNLPLDGIHWVIVGGESGPHARPMQSEWVTEIRDQCVRESVAFFFKQWGGTNKKRTGRVLEGRTWDEMPVLVGV